MKGLFLLLLLFQAQAFADEEFESFSPEESMAMLTEDEDLIKIEPVTYIRNKKASFCIRPTDMIDTIVIHHSETPNTATPEAINNYHLNRGSAADPWYMIAYSFVLNAAYPGATTPVSKASVGRPLNIVGAHAGSNVFVPMDKVQQDLWNQRKILCGKEGQIPKYDKTLVKNKKIKANVTTIGVVINGNYSLLSSSNPNGFSPAKRPTSHLIDMFARLSCQMQKKYPRITRLAYHNQYHSTSCPGTIQEKANMNLIKEKAKEYGCEFKLL